MSTLASLASPSDLDNLQDFHQALESRLAQCSSSVAERGEGTTEDKGHLRHHHQEDLGQKRDKIALIEDAVVLVVPLSAAPNTEPESLAANFRRRRAPVSNDNCIR